MSNDGFGYMVLTRTGDWFDDDWDGKVHRNIDDGYAALTECANAGYPCVLVALQLVDIGTRTTATLRPHSETPK